MIKTSTTNIAAIRTARGLKQHELAAALGIDRSTVTKWETGKSTPRAPVLLRMTDILHCTVDELLRGPAEAASEAAGERAGVKNTA